jgi:beta-lactamase class A
MSVARRALLLQIPALALCAPALADMGYMAALENRLGARIGVYAMTASGQRLYSYHANEWTAMCSTFKLPLAGAVLSRVDRNAESLDRTIALSASDLLPTSPITSAEAGKGQISIDRLVTAALETSDNTAANLLLKNLGGPDAYTRWLREIGDPSTRLDRYEPELNSALLGDQRDTTTPKTICETTRRLLFGDVLSEPSKQKIIKSMVASTTGRNLIRAGMPAGWRVGDKSGRGGNGLTGNVAVIWPPDQEPVIMAIYIADCAAPLVAREAAIAEIGKFLISYFPGGDAPGAPRFVTP